MSGSELLFDAVVKTLGAMGVPEMTPSDAHPDVRVFVVRETRLELVRGEDLWLRVTPRAPLAAHVRWCSDGSGLRVTYKGLAPRTLALEEADSFVFRGIRGPLETRLLLHVLFELVEYDHAMRRMLRDLFNEANSRRHSNKKRVGGWWEARIPGGERVSVEYVPLDVRLCVSYSDDCAYVLARPLDAVFERFVVWEGRRGADGLWRGVLACEDDVFVGAQEEEAGYVLLFEFRFPEEEARLRALWTALLSILAACLEHTV